MVCDHEHTAQFDALFRLQRPIRGVGGKPRDGEAGKPVIIHDAAVEQLYVADFAGMIAIHRVGKIPQQRRRIRFAAHALHPTRQRHRAAARVALNDDRREHHRHGRRSRDRDRDRIVGEIAAQGAEQHGAEDERLACAGRFRGAKRGCYYRPERFRDKSRTVPIRAKDGTRT